MKNRALNPAYALALCYAGMVCLAIAVNLMPIFLTTLRVDLGGRAGLTDEQLGRISAITFAGLVGGILFTGALADRLLRGQFNESNLIRFCSWSAVLRFSASKVANSFRACSVWPCSL